MPVIARLVAADEDTAREVIRRFNEIGLACLSQTEREGCPACSPLDDEDHVIATAESRPGKRGQPMTCWSIREQLVPTWPSTRPGLRCRTRPVRGRAHPPTGPGVRVRRVRAPGDPPDRGPLLGPSRRAGSAARELLPDRGVTLLPRLLLSRCRGASPRQGHRQHARRVAQRPGGVPGRWDHRDRGQHRRPPRPADPPVARPPRRRVVFTPTCASWANPIEAHFGVMHRFLNSDHPKPRGADAEPCTISAVSQRPRPPPRRAGRATA